LRYKQDRIDITNLIESNPNQLINTIWKQEGPLAIDNQCRCQMGNGENRSPFACAQCKNLRRLIDFRLGGVERPFQIECGEFIGKKLIVSKTDISMPFLTWDEDSSRRARNYVQQYNDLTICGTPNVSNLKCITGDSFTIRTLIMLMINKIFNDKGIPHIPKLHTAFICSGIGYSLYDMPSIGTISELHKIEKYHDVGLRNPIINLAQLRNQSLTTSEPKNFSHLPLKIQIARTIIIQLLVVLLELSSSNFSHGTPSIHGIIFTDEPVSYKYDNVHIVGPITLQISDLWNSSATFNNTHFFPKNLRSSMYIERNMFVPEISTKTVSMAHCYDIGANEENNKTSVVCPATMKTCPDTITYDVCKSRNIALYRLTNSTMDIYNAMRHIGFPLYVSSFDLYCFMVSLMCDKSFYLTVTNDEKLYRLWSMMWLIEDLHNVESLIKQAHDIQSIDKIPLNNRASGNIVINIIRGKWLRCDITKFLWSLIKLGW
jgi:hypothetical protein